MSTDGKGFSPHRATRRELMLGAGALFAWAYMPKLAQAEGRDPRLLVVILRGALDGLAAVAPVGDPDWVRLRGDKGLRTDGEYAALPLDNFFALNPAMPNFHRLYQAKQAAIVHAVATPYRERSHFDGQDVLESGIVTPGGSETGWLNRAWSVLQPADRVAARQAFAVGPITPLVARGKAPVMTWTPSKLPPATNDTMSRLIDLYRHTDPALAKALEERGALAAIVQGDMNGMSPKKIAATPGVPGAAVRAYFEEAAGAAAKFMARPDGPRVGALAFDGWDTHANEGADHGRLSALLGALDGAFGAMESNMGGAWKETVVVVATEFGRTARINGTDGTDHGTATVALLAGGALKGGRVIADWPGLSEQALYQARDLKPTTDLRAVLKGLLRDHLRAGEKALARDVFPGSEQVKPMDGLVV
ncbi:MAG: DUF1501 domain-containing protein [Proteobacteria bacterium]|nr:DUF1501 domain-containing protein [Pseudomonadota bacterium]